MPLPRKVKPGDPIRASDWNDLIDFVRSVQVQPSSGVRVTRGGSGTTLTVAPPKRSVGGSTAFDFTLTGTSSNDGSPQVTLSFGTVTGDGIALKNGVNPWPEELTADNTPPWSDTKDAPGNPWYAYLIVIVDSDPAGDGTQPPVIDSISWDVYDQPQYDSTPTTDSSGSTTNQYGTYYFLLGVGDITPDGKTARVANTTGKGSQVFGFCGVTGYFSTAGPAAIP